MPIWFKKRIQKAFIEKDKYQIHLLNQCWYFYRRTNNLN